MSNVPPAPFSVGKLKRSQMVFGDLVMIEDAKADQSANSLTYSPLTVPSSEEKSLRWDNQSPFAAGFLDDSKASISTIDAIDQEEVAKENILATEIPHDKKAISRKATERSEIRRVLGEKTQAAINTATESVNKTLNASRQSKKTLRQQKAAKSAEVHNEWKGENDEAKAFNIEAEKTRRQLLNMKRQFSSRVYRAKAKHHLDEKQARLNEVENESQFKSQVFREHQRRLKEEQDRRRRASIEARAQLRKNHRAGEEKMRLQAVDEHMALMEERHESSVAWRESKKNLAKQRRKSFAFRNGDARRIRELHKEMENQRQKDDSESYQLKWAGEEDAKAYQKRLQREKRESLAFRNEQGRRQRHDETNRALAELNRQHASYELKWQGERDARNYQKQLAEQRRDSFAFRNQEGRRQREEEAERHIEEQHREHESYELKWMGEKDAEAYRKKMEEERRQSLAFRNRQRAQHEKIMQELQQLSREQETESFILKWAGENDAKAYIAELEEERRQSLNFRNQEGARHRELDAEEHAKKIQAGHEEEILQAGCRKDVEQYKRDCAARDRASLCYRGKEMQLHRAEAEKARYEQRLIDDQNLVLEDAARTDVKQYVDDCKRRRRMSLALRAKEKREHARWEKRQKEKKIQAKHRDTRDQAMDQRYVELARQQERARIAMDAIRHTGRNFSVNPFGSVLE